MSAIDDISKSRRANRSFWNSQVRGAIGRYRTGTSSPHQPDYHWWKSHGERVVRNQLFQRNHFNYLDESLGGPSMDSYKN